MSATTGQLEQATGVNESAPTQVHANPTWKFYVMIGTILTVITATEVAVFYIPALRGVIVPILLVLSTGKFALVAMFFMHLRYDSPVFTGVFVAPLMLAVLVVVALIILFHILPHGISNPVG